MRGLEHVRWGQEGEFSASSRTVARYQIARCDNLYHASQVLVLARKR